MKKIILMSAMLISCFAFASSGVSQTDSFISLQTSTTGAPCVTAYYYTTRLVYHPMTKEYVAQTQISRACTTCYLMGNNGVASQTNCTDYINGRPVRELSNYIGE